MHHATRILVVDSEAAQRGALASALRAAGYETAACSTAAEAVRTSAAFRPDLVVLEMLLRGQVDGAALARRLRAERNPLLMFVTRDGSVAGRLAAFEAGADDYVVKPYLIDELLARVHVSILRRRLGQDADLIHTVRGVGYVLRDTNPVELQDP
jgi:DNA-binding response OmpR family regulator